MNSKQVLLAAPVFLFIALSFQSCNLSGALLNPGNPAKLSFSSSNSGNSDTRQSVSSNPSEDSLKPCGSSLSPGESCALQVQFTPTATGIRSGSAQIRSNGEVLEEVALTGQGE